MRILKVMVEGDGNMVKRGKFRCIFVMDLKGGIVVHARKGEREKYAPIHTFSSIVSCSDPMHVVSVVKPSEVYIADLDRIVGGKRDNRSVIMKIGKVVKDIMLDYGVRSVEDALSASEIAGNIVLGTETASLKLIEDVVREVPSGVRMSVSIDIKSGKILSYDAEIRKLNPISFAKMLNEHTLKDVIVLDLDKVGSKQGVNIELLRSIAEISVHNVLCGGGVRGFDDIKMLESAGVSGALVATAVHDGSIPLRCLR